MNINPNEILPVGPQFEDAITHYFGNDADQAATAYFRSCAVALIRCHQSGKTIGAPVRIAAE